VRGIVSVSKLDRRIFGRLLLLRMLLLIKDHLLPGPGAAVAGTAAVRAGD
jgi:hypothetical protein